MSLTCKTQASGNSIVITIPNQLLDEYKINNGDFVEIIPLRNGEIKKGEEQYFLGGLDE